MTARRRPQWKDMPYPVTAEEVAALFRAAAPPHPSDEYCAAIAKALSEAMPAHWRGIPDFERFASYHVVYPRQLEAIMALRRAIKRRLKLRQHPEPWFPANWEAVLDTLDQALTPAAPILAGPTANDPPERHWHRVGWNVAEMARLALDAAGHARVSVSRNSRAAQFTVAALARIGVPGVTAVAVERMHAEMRKRLAAKTDEVPGNR